MTNYQKEKQFIPLKYRLKGAIAILFFPNKHWELYKEKYSCFKKIKSPKIIMTLLVKNESDVLEENIKYHKSIGVDGFIITDNVSNDKTKDIILKYKKIGWVLDYIIEKKQNFNQDEWVHRMCLIAKNKYHADWIINADADEFYYTKKRNLKKQLSKMNRGVINIKSYNVLSLNETFWKLNDYVVKGELPENDLKDLIDNKKISKFSQLWNVSNKVIVRSSIYKHIGMGNHFCRTYGNYSPYNSKAIVIYHFNYRGFDHFLSKVVTGGSSITLNKRFNKMIGVHWRYFYNMYLNNKKELYDEYKRVNCSIILDSLIKQKVIVRDDTMKNILVKL